MSRFEKIHLDRAAKVLAGVADNAAARSQAFNIGADLDDIRAEIRELIAPHIDEIMAAIAAKLFNYAPVREALADSETSETSERGKAHFLEKLAKPIDAEWMARCGDFGTFAVTIGMPSFVALSTIHAGYEKCLELVIREGHPDPERFILIAQVVHRLTSFECEAVVAFMHEQLKRDQDARNARLSADFNSQVGQSVAAIDTSADQARNALERAVQLGSQMQATCNDVAASVLQSASAMDEAAKASAQISRAVTSLRQTTEDGKNRASDGARRSREAVESIENLQEASRDVGLIVKLIKDIAEQTNILALNATIEAARAGSEGAGFGVVAKEVKELAQRTADATTRVSQNVALIQDISKEIDETGREGASILEKISGQSSEMFDEFDTQSHALSSIAAAIDETAAVARLSTENLSRMTGSTASVSAEMNEVRGVIAKVSDRVKDLKQGAERFVGELDTGVSS